MRWYRALLVLGVGALLAGPASALSIVVSGPSEATAGDTVTFTISLDASTSITGYELFATWDPSELQYLPALDGLGGVTGNLTIGGFFPAFTTPIESQLPIGPTDGRFSFLSPSTFAATDLFQLDFEVLPGAGVADGLDFFVDLSMGGIAGPAGTGLVDLAQSGGVEVNPGSVVFNYVPVGTTVPEPTTLALFGFGVIGLYVGGRGRRS